MKLFQYQRLLSACYANKNPGACNKLQQEAKQQQAKIKQTNHSTYQGQIFQCYGENNKPACESLEKAFAVCVTAAGFQPS